MLRFIICNYEIFSFQREPWKIETMINQCESRRTGINIQIQISRNIFISNSQITQGPEELTCPNSSIVSGNFYLPIYNLSPSRLLCLVPEILWSHSLFLSKLKEHTKYKRHTTHILWHNQIHVPEDLSPSQPGSRVWEGGCGQSVDASARLMISNCLDRLPLPIP